MIAGCYFFRYLSRCCIAASVSIISYMGIQSVEIKNFKSIRDSGKIELGKINVLIGPNGVGKSNFIGFFKFLREIVRGRIQLYVAVNGTADDFLYFGPKHASFLAGTVTFDNDLENEYAFEMIPDQRPGLIFRSESSNHNQGESILSEGGNRESLLKEGSMFRDGYLREHMASFDVYHFHDTSTTAAVKRPCNLTDYSKLREDGGNLAAFLYLLKNAHPGPFRYIQQVVRTIAPYFDEFVLVPDEMDANLIQLRWREKGFEKLFSGHNLSDGTLRMICLATLLMQPKPPATIIIDEPELGLHPEAIQVLGGLIRKASHSAQIIISTQSVQLLEEFDPSDIIVVERKDEQTVLSRLSSEKLMPWLEEYSLGQLWQKNVLGGKP